MPFFWCWKLDALHKSCNNKEKKREGSGLGGGVGVGMLQILQIKYKYNYDDNKYGSDCAKQC
jgi:hypothetical protein